MFTSIDVNNWEVSLIRNDKLLIIEKTFLWKADLQAYAIRAITKLHNLSLEQVLQSLGSQSFNSALMWFLFFLKFSASHFLLLFLSSEYKKDTQSPSSEHLFKK